jgi:hypothetical protein
MHFELERLSLGLSERIFSATARLTAGSETGQKRLVRLPHKKEKPE